MFTEVWRFSSQRSSTLPMNRRQLFSVATFATGFLVRPLGALLFGSIGDRVGRKSTFLMTLILMGIATALVGVLPTFETAGYFAPIALVLGATCLAS
ncbi:MFS transporter [Mesorhizobium sp.]|uniref:MFS transporter n=1 Tax=Mesorhizobium sp. TaxID=1871066 RepID=UPI0025E3A498|nr:MFS transporter [Mesorhizobium sp.]